MSGYIDQESAIKIIDEEIHCAVYDDNEHCEEVLINLKDRIMRDIPAADVAPICRFSKEEISRAMARTGKSEEETIRILQEWDKGHGDVDDILDAWEDAPSY